VCLGEALRPEFQAYAQQIKLNAQVLAETLASHGIGIVSGGTDTHIVLLDLTSLSLTGNYAETTLDSANITSNKNPIPFDKPNPLAWSGLRLGVAAATTRGFKEPQFKQLGKTIASLLCVSEEHKNQIVMQAQKTVAALCKQFPIYEGAL
jgi:glycine hydroxymethyltransferase